jgi:nitroimidazol reductase NimA-like FMN-containing flavoprotein (pyridoxamine 5'-phosphate oxidase superfamily)
MSDRKIEHLDQDECLRLISPGGIGRIGFQSRYGPVILPVNYKLHDGVVVFRTAEHNSLDEDLQTGIAGGEFKVAFEIDEFDLTARSGWSVLVRGSAHRVRPGSERESAEAVGVEPWPGGDRELFMSITPTTPGHVTGRRLTAAR